MKPAIVILYITCCVAHFYFEWHSSLLTRIQNDAVSDTTKAEYNYIR